MNPLLALRQCGQSVWLDHISRRLITDGTLQRLIDADGLAGMTSNPTLFDKAIAGSGDYDAALQRAVETNRNAATRDVVERLIVEDIQSAADVFLPLYRDSDGLHGFVSLEVSPDVAHDTDATIGEARHDHVAGGRLTLGLGAGWQQNEHTAYGIELPPVRQRLDRFEESTRVIRALLSGGSVDFDGAHFQLADARCDPTPVQQPLPLLVAGAGERRTIPIAARHGDAWHAWADPSEFRRKSAVLDEACSVAGRDPASVRRLTGQVAARDDRRHQRRRRSCRRRR